MRYVLHWASSCLHTCAIAAFNGYQARLLRAASVLKCVLLSCKRCMTKLAANVFSSKENTAFAALLQTEPCYKLNLVTNWTLLQTEPCYKLNLVTNWTSLQSPSASSLHIGIYMHWKTCNNALPVLSCTVGSSEPKISRLCNDPEPYVMTLRFHAYVTTLNPM